MLASDLLRRARTTSGLTQVELANRLGTTQPEIARLESPHTNPRLQTLRRAVEATGHRLELRLTANSGNVDETMIASNLSLPPRERLVRFQDAYKSVARLTSRVRGG